jgi:hypothetical protein
MLKNFGYGGAYRDENISVSVLLENPLDYGIEAAKLVFSVAIEDKNSGTSSRLEDFIFYIMDEGNHLYHFQNTPCLNHDTEASTDDIDPVQKPDGLIITDINYAFLFQDLRIAFRYPNHTDLRIIELKH